MLLHEFFCALVNAEAQNHRLVWVGGHLKDQLIPTPCRGRGHLPLDQIAPSPTQPGLKSCSAFRNALLFMVTWLLLLFFRGTSVASSGDFPGHHLLWDVLSHIAPLLHFFASLPCIHSGLFTSPPPWSFSAAASGVEKKH